MLINFRCPSCHRTFSQVLDYSQIANISNSVCPKCGHQGLIQVTTHKAQQRSKTTRKENYGRRI